ncbi:hypothetical protein [Chitinophaga sp. LS1]|uniref:hypothetical protein n=1 Tax=Chitinophaga sp. LS1 TaxID=3051176 RepID=UPI002AABB819|nr:hypothetical protein [Chitinophaga sp. LS1]WPV63898.1 hypothetical protein QQL36_19045 [Chitinophaga sp. LS1]
MNEIEILFLEKAIIRGGTLIFSKQDTLDFIEQCRIFEIRILGIDGFFITEKTTQPSMENSVNYSSYPPNKNIYDSALEFVAKKDDNLFFEIVCG